MKARKLIAGALAATIVFGIAACSSDSKDSKKSKEEIEETFDSDDFAAALETAGYEMTDSDSSVSSKTYLVYEEADQVSFYPMLRGSIYYYEDYGDIDNVTVVYRNLTENSGSNNDVKLHCFEFSNSEDAEAYYDAVCFNLDELYELRTKANSIKENVGDNSQILYVNFTNDSGYVNDYYFGIYLMGNDVITCHVTISDIYNSELIDDADKVLDKLGLPSPSSLK